MVEARIENDDVRKEVDFTCYVLEGEYERSVINWNQMVNTSTYSEYRTIYVPGNLSSRDYTVQCEGAYYHFGSRVDIYLPETSRLVVAEGDVVHSGTDPLATLVHA